MTRENDETRMTFEALREVHGAKGTNDDSESAHIENGRDGSDGFGGRGLGGSLNSPARLEASRQFYGAMETMTNDDEEWRNQKADILASRFFRSPALPESVFRLAYRAPFALKRPAIDRFS
jgi:hypothetical protein